MNGDAPAFDEDRGHGLGLDLHLLGVAYGTDGEREAWI